VVQALHSHLVRATQIHTLKEPRQLLEDLVLQVEALLLNHLEPLDELLEFVLKD